MKYTPETVSKILNALKEGRGRVRAVKMAGIHYDTFREWLKNKPEFQQAVLEAEEQGRDAIENYCLEKILADSSWQSAAWILERTFPEKYGRRLDTTTRGEIVIVDEK